MGVRQQSQTMNTVVDDSLLERNVCRCLLLCAGPVYARARKLACARGRAGAQRKDRLVSSSTGRRCVHTVYWTRFVCLFTGSTASSMCTQINRFQGDMFVSRASAGAQTRQLARHIDEIERVPYTHTIGAYTTVGHHKHSVTIIHSHPRTTSYV
jgi:hypothetical protein